MGVTRLTRPRAVVRVLRRTSPRPPRGAAGALVLPHGGVTPPLLGGTPLVPPRSRPSEAARTAPVRGGTPRAGRPPQRAALETAAVPPEGGVGGEGVGLTASTACITVTRAVKDAAVLVAVVRLLLPALARLRFLGLPHVTPRAVVRGSPLVQEVVELGAVLARLVLAAATVGLPHGVARAVPQSPPLLRAEGVLPVGAAVLALLGAPLRPPAVPRTEAAAAGRLSVGEARCPSPPAEATPLS